MTKIAAEKVLVLDSDRVCPTDRPASASSKSIAKSSVTTFPPSGSDRFLQGADTPGGPSSVYEAGAPKCDPQIFHLGLPVLGICDGMQLFCEALGGRVQSTPAREYGGRLPAWSATTSSLPACRRTCKSG